MVKIPIDKTAQLIPNQNMFTARQSNNLANATRLGSPFFTKPTKKQSFRFLSTLLASIDVPLLLKALTGNGIQDYSKYQPPPPLPPQKSDSNGIQVGANNESLVPQGLLLGKNLPFNGVLLVKAILLIKHCPITI